MTARNIIPLILACCSMSAWAFPPGPYHEIYGTVRDEQGNPLNSGTVDLSSGGSLVQSAPVDQSIGAGVNYSLKISMDSGVAGDNYQADALSVNSPFTISVVIDSVSYVPIEVVGNIFNLGEIGERTRLDLTLGVDSDGDGLPDSWEQNIIALVEGVDGLLDVTADGDSDNDGVSNFDEYIAGTYPFDRRASFSLAVIEVKSGFARLRFLSAPGRTYTIKSSADLITFGAERFSLNADGSEDGAAYLATQVKFQDVYVPVDVEVNPATLYTLHVD